MKIAIDVLYRDNTAKIVAAVFDDWQDEVPKQVVVKYQTPVADYIPGEFYKRELPCLADIIADFNLNEIEVVVIDGYVYLNDVGKPGLGVYLHEHLQQKVPVIGVAKSSFYNNTLHVKEVLRGDSLQPLYVTAIGTDLTDAAQNVKNMRGAYRMPHILKLIDTETRK